MSSSGRRLVVVIVGAGASGTLSAIDLAASARRRNTGVDIVMVDPADPGAFAPRREYGVYLADTLEEEFRRAGTVASLRHLRTCVAGLRRRSHGVTAILADGHELEADAVVIASGEPGPRDNWAPAELLASPFFVANPWLPGAIDVVRRDQTGPPDVLLVGAGLTMVDLALSLSGPDRRADRHLLAVSRHGASEWGRLRHRMAPSSGTVLDGLTESGHFTHASAEVTGAEPLGRGGLRVTLSEASSHDVGWVVNCTGPVGDRRDAPDPLFADLLQPRGGVAFGSLATGGMGLRTTSGRLVDSQGTSAAPVWTLGSLRRGELWESTDVPEIRSQALALAEAVLDDVAPLPRRLEGGRLVSGHHPTARPRDPLGLPLSTTAEAATAYNTGLERLMRLQSGAEELLGQAVAIDPDFALGHAALAMLGHEAGAQADVAACLEAARLAVRKRGDERERSLVDVVGRRVEDVRHTGASALMNHIAHYPRDVLAVSAAVPTIAFSGVTDIQQEAWELVEGLAPAYGDHWWYISLLAFTRQDQFRLDDAGMLAESALFCEPSSGHAVHAQTHVMYETGRHESGRIWLDHWVTESGRSASHRAHFSWHAALHELALGDTEAVRQRYYTQLAPPTVTGVRALIDTASLLWRWRVTTSDWAAAAGGDFADTAAPPPIQCVLEAVEPEHVDRPQTPFVAMHAALALAAAGDLPRLAALRTHCASSSDVVMRTTVTSLCAGLLQAGERDWGRAADTLRDLLPGLLAVGGSAAQREIVEETLLFCLVNAGRADQALALLDGRLDRRASPLDARRRRSLVPLSASL
ncbi:MAG: FAD/NAD(P)-binding protein [Nocardioides sp.]